MASVTELLQLADYMAKNKQENSPAGGLAGLVQSGFAGFNEGQQIKSAQLDRQVKTLDLQKKQADLEQEGINRKISINLAKRMGLLDLNPNESNAGRSAALDSATNSKPVPDNTSSGRMASIYAGNEAYHVVPGGFSTEKGLSFDFKADKSDKTTQKDPTSQNERVRKAAEDAARREKFNSIASLVGPEEAQKYANVQPTEDEIQKYVPEMDSYLNGNKKAAQSLRDNRRESDKVVTSAIQNLQTQIEDQRARLGVNATGGSDTTAYSMFHKGDQEALDKLVKRRDELLQNGTPETIKTQLRQDIEELKQDPQKNRAEIIDKTKQLLQLAQTRRKS